MSARDYVHVADTAELPPGRIMLVEAHGATVALANVEGSFHAFGNECTHDGGPLGEGEVEGGIVTCPWHFSRFCVRTGQVLESPAEEAVPVYEVRVEGTSILVGAPR